MGGLFERVLGDALGETPLEEGNSRHAMTTFNFNDLPVPIWLVWIDVKRKKDSDSHQSKLTCHGTQITQSMSHVVNLMD